MARGSQAGGRDQSTAAGLIASDYQCAGEAEQRTKRRSKREEGELKAAGKSGPAGGSGISEHDFQPHPELLTEKMSEVAYVLFCARLQRQETGPVDY